jgi:hypothetical protein
MAMELGFPATRDQIERDLQTLKPLIESLTGLTSRWNGKVELVANATFKGLKPFDCAIWIGDTFVHPDERWTTLIHELLHSVSAGYNRFDFENCVGWEEGAVEMLQRMLRTEIFAALGLVLADDLLQQLDANHPFNHYITALERIRDAFVMERRAFYIDLLSISIKERYGVLLTRANALTAPARLEAIRTLSAVQVTLRQGKRPQ